MADHISRGLHQRHGDQCPGGVLQIRHGKKGKGQLVIGYNSLDELPVK
ncbi:hypothetical protein [Klebsiella variicola]